MPSSDNDTNTVDAGNPNPPLVKSSPKGIHLDRVLADRYKIEKTIGSGGMGEIYLATDNKLQRKVAIKMMLHPDEGSDNKRFELESQTVAGFSDPHTIRLFDYGVTDEGYQYQVIEYLDGCNVKEYIKKRGPLKPTVAKAVGIQICGSLAEAHRKNILHRDIKPSNIMLIESPERGMHSKLLDFGLARADNHDPTITKTGMVLGSPMYMSPEQIDKKSDELTSLTDVYSLGLTLYTIVTGKPPFIGGSLSSILASQLFHAPQALVEVLPALRDESALCWIIETAIQKQPEDRFTSISQMKRALTLAIQNPTASLYLQNRELYCDDECVQDFTSPSLEAISLTSHLSLSKNDSSDASSIETIKQQRPTGLVPQDGVVHGDHNSKTSIVLAGLLLVCVGVFIWTEFSNSPTVTGSTIPTPTKVVTKQPINKIKAPAFVSLPVNSDPVGASILLNDKEIGKTPSTINLSPEEQGTLVLRKSGFEDYSIVLPTVQESITASLVSIPNEKTIETKQKLESKKTAPKKKATPKNTDKKKSEKLDDIKKIENPFKK